MIAPPGIVAPRWLRRLSALLFAGFAGVAMAVVWTEPAVQARAGILAWQQLRFSGVENPVTAVLLNFRSFDTLLELAVLLVAIIPMLALRQPITAPEPPVSNMVVMQSLTGLVAPLATITAIYLLWNGARLPGGAFQAGALLAAVAVLLQAMSPQASLRMSFEQQTGLLVAGFTVFAGLGLAFAWVAPAYTAFAYPIEQASLLIISIEVVATASIAMALSQYVWCLPARRGSL